MWVSELAKFQEREWIMEKYRSHIASFAGIVLILIIGLTGCSKRDSSTESEAEKPQIALIMKSLANEFFKTMEEGARTHHAAHTDAHALSSPGLRQAKDHGGHIIEKPLGAPARNRRQRSPLPYLTASGDARALNRRSTKINADENRSPPARVVVTRVRSTAISMFQLEIVTILKF